MCVLSPYGSGTPARRHDGAGRRRTCGILQGSRARSEAARLSDRAANRASADTDRSIVHFLSKGVNGCPPEGRLRATVPAEYIGRQPPEYT